MSKTKKRKPLCKKGGWVIGIDESNNGFSFHSKNPHHNGDAHLTIAGYLMHYNEHRNYRYGSEFRKKGFFGKKYNKESNLVFARDYLNSNPNFYYLNISKEEASKSPMFILRAQATAAITLKFFLNHDIQLESTNIILDDITKFQLEGYKQDSGNLIKRWINSHTFSDYVADETEALFKNLNLSVNHHSREGADKYVPATIKADRVSYCISAINNLGSSPNWAFPNKRLTLKSLKDLENQLIKYRYLESFDIETLL